MLLKAALVFRRWLYHEPPSVISFGKSQTYSVESDNVELHHYLARLRRKNRYSSRPIDAVR